VLQAIFAPQAIFVPLGNDIDLFMDTLDGKNSHPHVEYPRLFFPGEKFMHVSTLTSIAEKLQVLHGTAVPHVCSLCVRTNSMSSSMFLVECGSVCWRQELGLSSVAQHFTRCPRPLDDACSIPQWIPLRGILSTQKTIYC